MTRQMRTTFAVLAGLAVAASLPPRVAAGQTGDLRLVEAVRNRDIASVRALVRQVDVNTAQPDGATALHWAAQWNDLEAARVLIRANADVRAANDYGVTPFWFACNNGSATMVEMLLQAGADPNTALPTGETALMTAARTGRAEAVALLLSRGANANAKEHTRGQTALMWAISEGHVETARMLVERGADVQAASAGGFTPLMFAARNGVLEAARRLLFAGARVNAISADGSTALLTATVRGHVPVAELLLDHGADPNIDAAGYTPLHWASGTWETMLTHDYHLVRAGEIAAYSGLREGRMGLIKTLLAHGANPDVRLAKEPPRFGYTFFQIHGGGKLDGATPFLLAVIAGDVSVMRLLVASGADPRLGTADGTTPLHVAAGIAVVEEETWIPEAAHLAAVQLVLELGSADINAVNAAGNTPLHGAAYVGFNTVVQWLANQDAALNIKNKKGETPLRVAEGVVEWMQVFQHESTAALLRTLGGVSQ